MWKEIRALILAALPLGTANVYAYNDDIPGPALPGLQTSPNLSLPRIDYPAGSPLTAPGKTVIPGPVYRDEAIESRNHSIAPNGNSSSGLHWVPDNQHPALEFRFSEQGAIRLHPSRHGGTVGAAWNF